MALLKSIFPYRSDLESLGVLTRRFALKAEGGALKNPAQEFPIISAAGPDSIEFYTWGLILPWYVTGITGGNMFCLQSELIGKRPVFQSKLLERCLVITSGYFVTTKARGTSKVNIFTVPHTRFTPLAGLCANTLNPETGTSSHTFTIILNRTDVGEETLYTPVVLSKTSQDTWLDKRSTKPVVEELFTSYEAVDAGWSSSPVRPPKGSVTHKSGNLPYYHGLISPLNSELAN